MSAVSFSTQSSVSVSTLQINLIAEVKNLSEAISKGDFQRVREIARSLTGEGRKLIAMHILEKEGPSPLPTTIMLIESLGSDRLQWEDETRYLLAKCTRLFMELTCIKCTQDKRTLYPETKKSLRDQIDKVQEHAKEDQVGLIYELKCASEALKLIEEMDPKYPMLILETLSNLGLSSIQNLLREIPNLVKQIGKEWFSEALYIYWIGTLARDNLELFKEQRQTIAQRLESLEIAQTAVEFFGDIVLHGSSNIRDLALTGEPGLISLANLKDPRFILLRSAMWPVRFRAIELLSDLTSHDDPKIAKAATQALLVCRLRESNPNVKKLLEQLEKSPKIHSQWKEQFEAKKGEFIDGNLQEKEGLEKLEKALEDRERTILGRSEQLKKERKLMEQEKFSLKKAREELDVRQSENQEQNSLVRTNLEKQAKILKDREQEIFKKETTNRQASKQLDEQKLATEHERAFVRAQLEECETLRANIEVMHKQMNKRVNEVLDMVLAPQTSAVPKRMELNTEEDVPNDYICSITNEIMKDPVMTEAGHSYERFAIEKWLLQKKTDPKSQKPISNVLIPNHALRGAIEEYTNKKTLLSQPAPVALPPSKIDSSKQKKQSYQSMQENSSSGSTTDSQWAKTSSSGPSLYSSLKSSHENPSSTSRLQIRSRWKSTHSLYPSLESSKTTGGDVVSQVETINRKPLTTSRPEQASLFQAESFSSPASLQNKFSNNGNGHSSPPSKQNALETWLYELEKAREKMVLSYPLLLDKQHVPNSPENDDNSLTISNEVRLSLGLPLIQGNPSYQKNPTKPVAALQNTHIISPIWKKDSFCSSIAFGKAKWEKYFGDVGVEPPLPADIEAILQSPCPFWGKEGKKVGETHLLVLIPQTLNGKPLTLQNLHKLFKNPKQGFSVGYHGFYPGNYNADTITIASHWVLMTRDVIPGSRNKSYSYQEKLVSQAPSYKVPKVLDATICIFTEYVRTGSRLYSDMTYTRNQEMWNKDWHLVIGDFSEYGLNVNINGDNVCGFWDCDIVGIAGLRKLE
ncbi:MAG: hypothetical protein JSR58_02620 [Verrucomicrobia bacterium]|nr:hypothetical protein [Verrucomicrobiota bacterium]